jgi:ribose transport system substrate-binding protein
LRAGGNRSPLLLILLAAALAAPAVWLGVRHALAFPSDNRIAFIAQTTGNELWEAAHAGARAAALHNDMQLYWNAPTRSDDVERQIELVESSVRRRDAGLVIAPVQALALISPLREALANNMPVAVVGSSVPIPAGNKLAFVLNDDVGTGKLAARQVGALLRGSGAVAILGLNPNLTGNWIRTGALESTLASEFHGISIVERRTSSPTLEEAAESAEQILTRYARLDAIVALTSTDGEGALTAIRLLHRAGTIHLVACDQELALMKGIREGSVDAVVAENSYLIGQRSVQAIADLRRGRSVDSAVIVPPMLITRDNIDTRDVQQVLSTNWRGGP